MRSFFFISNRVLYIFIALKIIQILIRCEIFGLVLKVYRSFELLVNIIRMELAKAGVVFDDRK